MESPESSEETISFEMSDMKSLSYWVVVFLVEIFGSVFDVGFSFSFVLSFFGEVILFSYF
jgi:hypothetical protein